MPLIRFLEHEIIVPISPIEVADGVWMARKAHVETISIEPTHEKVTLYIRVNYYDGDDKLMKRSIGIQSYVRQSIADMDVIVDADPSSESFGVPLTTRQEEYIPNPVPQEEGEEDYEPTILNPILEGKTYMYEYELFRSLMEQPVKVYDLAVGKIQYSAAMGKLD